MASLFDVAAGLSQYDDAGSDSHGYDQSPTEQLSMLSLLDDTLLNIYTSPKGPTQVPPPLLMPTIARTSSLQTVDPESGRRSRLPPAASSSPPPLRLPAVVKPSEAATPAPPSSNNQFNASIRASPSPMAAASNTEADVVARNVLRDIAEEMEQLSLVTAPDAQLMVRMLKDKYLERRLSKLPRTPFVQLSCRKVQQKLDQLSQRAVKPAPVKTDDPQVHEAEPEDHVVATWQKLETITPGQEQMLRNLMRVPSSRLLQLPPAQQELVRFAKRYEKLLTLTPQDLQHLPTRHQQLIGKMQSQRRASLPPTTGNQ